MSTSDAVHHLDYLGVQVAWVTGPWFLSIFMNMLPWESGQVLCCVFLTLKRSCVDMHLISICIFFAAWLSYQSLHSHFLYLLYKAYI